MRSSIVPKSRHRLVLLALLSLILALPILQVGFVVDDYPQLMAIRGHTVGGATPYDLYRFTSSDPAEVKRIIEQGPWGWWADPEVQASFFRPYASLLLNIDHALFGLDSRGYAAHTLLYNTLLVLVVALFFRRILPHRAAWLAALLFAIDDLHLQAAAWIAARYSIIAPMFAVLGLLAYIRHREEAWRPGLPAAVLCFLLSLSCGEIALSALAFFGMYEIVIRRDPWKTRCLALTPFAVTTGIYLLGHRAWGYGVANSTLYVHPITDPGRFMQMGIKRITWLLGDLLGGVPADFSLAFPELQPALLVVGLIMTALFALSIRGAYRGLEGDDKRLILWLLSASLLAVVPTLGAPSGGRMLVLPSVGVLGAVGLMMTRAWGLLRPERQPPAKEDSTETNVAKESIPWHGRTGLWLGLLWLGWVNVVAAPMVGFIRVKGLTDLGRLSSEALLKSEAQIRKADSVLIIQCTNPFVGVFGAAEIAVTHAERHELHSSWHTLSLADRAHRITRTGPRSFTVEIVDGDVLDNVFAKVFRADNHPMRAGHEVETRTFTVRVEAENRGHPSRFHVELKRSLDDPAFFLARCTSAGLEPATLPEPGESVVWKPSPLPIK